MSDPLSVAGSAVGIISLGIQVCQGLISYLQSFKSQDQDIQDSLNDIQTVTSILYSLKGVLPKVDKSASEIPAIRRCLAESEEKLREFQQFSLKLRANESLNHDVVGRMDHARRALLYPFREGKLKSLCQSLNGLLQNLSLCLDITSLDIVVGIHANVDGLGNAFKDQGANVAKLSDQLQRLDNSMLAYHQNLKSEISQAQLFAQDFRQEIGGELRLISTDIGFLMSNHRRHQEDINQCLLKAFDELKEQNDFQNELIRTTLGVDNMPIQNVGSRRAIALKLSVRFSLSIETGSPLHTIKMKMGGLTLCIAGDENGTTNLELVLNGSEYASEVPPVFQAIFQESTTMLEVAVSKSPEAVTESLYGVTTVRLCLCWPEGLNRLLQTKAVDVVDEYDLQAAVDADCIESVDLLLKAGCPVNYELTTELIFRDASERCMDVIASNLARRRSDLLSLAQQQQVVGQDLSYAEECYKFRPTGLCSFLHTALRDATSSGYRITVWCIEVVRFLTFEALEMTHTCCDFTTLYRPDISSESFDVLMNCEPERWQKIRSDKREQENAALLESLMEEFIAHMTHMESSPRSLEIFINGYWRRRMSEIYAVDFNEIENIKNCLVGTKTHVLPTRARVLLGWDFQLIKLENLKSEPTPVGETSHDERVELGDESFEMPPCDGVVGSGNEID
ncbi:hypothetical protein FCOIX_9393 [Fusarium coicis]|nr:hypothetical protein FCOIX_9393 [Fusarium coicis]